MGKQILLLLFCLSTAFCNAQFYSEYKKSEPMKTTFAFNVDKGGVVIHTKAIEELRGTQPIGFGFELSKQAKDSATFHLSSAYPRMGLQFHFYHYGSPILGNSGMIAYFIQPVYRLNNNLNFFYRATFGFSYSDNPFRFESKIDTLNQCYSLRVNPYLQISAGWGLKLSKNISVEFAGHFNHISNGNIKRPNRGLNWITASAGIVYHPLGSLLPKYHRVHDKIYKGRPFNYTLGLLYVGRQDYAGTTMGYQRTYAAGGFVEASKQIGRIHGVVAGIQSYYNHLETDPLSPDIPVIAHKHSSVLAGLYVGHEFLMGRVIISQVIGRYVTQHPAMYNNYFHQHSLRYLIEKHWMAGFCFRAHEDEADFIGLNALYRF